MDLILTSFGASHLPERYRHDATNIFYRMPPVRRINTGSQFEPDYAALLLADRVIIDRKTYDILMTGRHAPYGRVRLVVKALYDEGFVRLEDFDSIIDENRTLLDTILTRDLVELNSWVEPLKESILEWHKFSTATAQYNAG